MERRILSLVYGSCLLLIAHSARIERIGNEIVGSTSGVDQAGATLLMAGNALQRGRLFAFSAFVRNENPAVFQIWRQIGIDGNEYSLVSETRFMPTVLNKREDFYLTAQFIGCPLIENGDKLGIYTTSKPSPVAYQFSAVNPTSLMNVNDNITDPYQIGDEVAFDKLPFPYMLSAAAYIDTEIDNVTVSGNTVDCPNLLIPKEVVPTLPPTTTKAPPTGAPGATGPTGPMGQQGVPGPRGKQGEPGVNGTRGPTGPQGAAGNNGSNGLPGTQGVEGPQGPQGDTGAAGPRGAQGVPGDDGEDGRDGRPGMNITIIERVNGNDTNGPDTDAVTDAESIWMDPLIIMILVIWLIVVTVILLILTCVFCCYVCCKKEEKEDKPDYAHLNRQKSANGTYVNVGYAGGEEFSSDPEKKKNVNRLSSFEPGEAWISTMKQDDTVDYENSTIDREASKKGKPPPLSDVPTHVYEGDGSGKKIPKTPDSVLDGGANTTEVTVEVPDTPNHPAPPPLPGAEATVSTSPNGANPTTPTARWSQSQDQMIAY